MGSGAKRGRTKFARVSETAQRLLGLDPSGSRSSSSFLVTGRTAFILKALQYPDIVRVKFDPLATADQLGKTLVRCHNRERVELVGAGILDHVLGTRM